MLKYALIWQIKLVDDMAQQVTNFGRFYSAFHKLTIHGEPEETKRQLVLQYTAGRTDSLREMTREGYNNLCIGIEGLAVNKEELRKERSTTLRLMQKMGVDTSDWSRVNALCRDSRIAGKEFYLIDAGEHRELRRKLRSIERKGGLRPRREAKADDKSTAMPKHKPDIYLVPMGPMGLVLN